MDDDRKDWHKGSEDDYLIAEPKSILLPRDCGTVDELINWIIEDANYQSAQYLQETKVDCNGE